MKAILLLFFLTSCSIVPAIYRDSLVDAYVKEYEGRSGCKVLIPIDFADYKPNKDGTRTVGSCVGFKTPMLFRRILLDRSHWNKSNGYAQESVLLHELGHCVNDLDHDDTRILPPPFYSRPTTLMNSFTFPEYGQHREEYLNEFYKRAKCN